MGGAGNARFGEIGQAIAYLSTPRTNHSNEAGAADSDDSRGEEMKEGEVNGDGQDRSLRARSESGHGEKSE